MANVEQERNNREQRRLKRALDKSGVTNTSMQAVCCNVMTSDLRVALLFVMFLQDACAFELHCLACPACPDGKATMHTGPSDDDNAKKQRPDTTSGTEYVPESQDLPSWITERVRPCHALAHKAGQQGPPTASQQPQHSSERQSQQVKGKSKATSEQPQSEALQHVLYWMRTALRG